jgi:hypothetical protein
MDVLKWWIDAISCTHGIVGFHDKITHVYNLGHLGDLKIG